MVVDINKTENKYKVIYADPPWKYNTWKDGMGTAEKHYPTMKTEQIIEMKDTIQKISDKDCILFMWVTFPCLIEGLKVIKEWYWYIDEGDGLGEQKEDCLEAYYKIKAVNA